MHIRLIFEGEDNPPLVRGDFLEVREVPVGSPVAHDTGSATNSSLTLLNFPATDEQLVEAAAALLGQLVDVGDGTEPPVVLNERRYSFEWDSFNNGQQIQLTRNTGNARRGLIGDWSAFRDYQVLDRDTVTLVTLASVMLPGA